MDRTVRKSTHVVVPKGHPPYGNVGCPLVPFARLGCVYTFGPPSPFWGFTLATCTFSEPGLL